MAAPEPQLMQHSMHSGTGVTTGLQCVADTCMRSDVDPDQQAQEHQEREPPEQQHGSQEQPQHELLQHNDQPAWQSYSSVFTAAKAGMQGVDQERVKQIVYEMSKASGKLAMGCMCHAKPKSSLQTWTDHSTDAVLCLIHHSTEPACTIASRSQ